MATENRQWILARRPAGEIKDGDLVFRTDPIPTPGRGEIVVKTEWLSLDPTNRIWMSDIPQYMPPVPLGAPMRGLICGTVVKSASDSVAEGTVVMGLGTWSDYARVPAAMVVPVPEIKGIPRKDVFGQLYLVGPTAYFGLTDIGAPKIGETLVVSGAAGAVGSIVGQLGKALGCKTVGIAGGKEKCAALTRDYGFDHAIDYKSENIKQRLREICPERVDIYFDNVGGETLNMVLAQMNLFGRIVQCGMISVYDSEGAGAAPSNYPLILMQRLKVQGFIVLDYAARYPEAFRALAKLRLEGKMNWHFHDIVGLENADNALRMLFKGQNTGKLIVKVADPA
jgi:NADPH-dependent curcumin reductase CurA